MSRNGPGDVNSDAYYAAKPILISAIALLLHSRFSTRSLNLPSTTYLHVRKNVEKSAFRRHYFNNEMRLEARITDVTSLGSPRVCVAALADNRTIRLRSPTPSESWIDNMGSLSPGDLIVVEWHPRKKPYPPHVEDGDWNPADCTKLKGLPEDELARQLKRTAFQSVEDAFGPPWIEARNGNCAFHPGKGSRSLASVRASSVTVRIQFGKARVAFEDATRSWAGVPLQDLAVKRHFNGCKSCQSKGANRLQSEFNGGPALLRMGLAREFQVGNYPSACWMQINHVFLMPSKRNHFL